MLCITSTYRGGKSNCREEVASCLASQSAYRITKVRTPMGVKARHTHMLNNVNVP